ncbi:MAG: hypothetical protein RR540_08220, partial [Oscillospiraceae bacterium]
MEPRNFRPINSVYQSLWDFLPPKAEGGVFHRCDGGGVSYCGTICRPRRWIFRACTLDGILPLRAAT